MLTSLSTMLQRSDASAFQAECRGFDPRLPLQPPFLRASDG